MLSSVILWFYKWSVLKLIHRRVGSQGEPWLSSGTPPVFPKVLDKVRPMDWFAAGFCVPVCTGEEVKRQRIPDSSPFVSSQGKSHMFGVPELDIVSEPLKPQSVIAVFVSFSIIVNNDNAPPPGIPQQNGKLCASYCHQRSLVLDSHGLVCHYLRHSFPMPYITFPLAQKYVCLKQSTSCCPRVTPAWGLSLSLQCPHFF